MFNRKVLRPRMSVEPSLQKEGIIYGHALSRLDETVTLLPNTKLGQYEIRSKIGEGGMGQVYLARDTKLGREVAIKVLPTAFAADEERLARFEREARLLATLNHPFIASVYGFEDLDHTKFLVMELAEGTSLETRIARGPLPVEEALHLALQIAEALEAAHERGVIHRDLKPSNIQITSDDQVKVLDFGLAKALTEQPAPDDLSQSPTVLQQTQAGVILGTAAYMSPEQAKGKPVDKRTDIWAFGCVLFELLTGKQPFIGDTVTETLAAILRAEPDWSLLPAAVPQRMRTLLMRCLQKNARNRLRDIGDARIEIADALNGVEGPSRALAAPEASKAIGRRVVLFVTSGTIAVAILTAFALWPAANNVKPLTSAVNRFAIPLPDNFTLALTKFVPLAIGRTAIAMSPDGSNLVYVANNNGTAQLVLRPLNQFQTKPIPGTEGAYNPFFSPDGRWVAFFADNKLKKVSLAGGEPVILCEARNPVGADWGDDDTIYFGDQEGGTLTKVLPNGATQTVQIGGLQISEVNVLPGSKSVLFSSFRSTNPDYSEISALSLEDGKIETVLQGGSNPRYISAGYLLFTRAGALMGAPFDLARRQTTGSAVVLIEGIRAETYGNAQFGISDNGTLVYIPGTPGWIGKPVWIDREGKITEIPLPAQCYGSFKLSPDGKQLAISISGAKEDIWVYDFERGTLLRLTVEGTNINPVWSPDSKRIAFAQVKDGQVAVFAKSADGSGVEEQLSPSRSYPGQMPESWSPDGKALTFGQWSATDQGDIWILPLEGDRQPQPFLQTKFSEFFSAFSPNGRWIVYTSDESGRYEVYVRPYPGPGGKWQVSTEGGEEPVWSANGEELFYRNGEKWMVARVHTNDGFRSETPKLLFERHFINVPGLSHSVSSDGKRQVMIQPLEQEDPKQINVVLNWFAELQLRVAEGKK